MWLGIFGVLILVLLLAAGIALGGIFTLILVPVAVVAGIGALISLLMARQSQIATGGDRKPTSTVSPERPLPRSAPEPGPPAEAPTTPEGLADARRGASGR
jgi:hypothetical protein